MLEQVSAKYRTVALVLIKVSLLTRIPATVTDL